ncbi:hypothetical protein ACIBCT_05550 [Streptosporangium sp. NPDC050855]|uniref:hypothetical protein n=1 Tax=Streptosporangium sp. NPDC050855 TaxID=3366194 RepID=UPI00379D6215
MIADAEVTVAMDPDVVDPDVVDPDVVDPDAEVADAVDPVVVVADAVAGSWVVIVSAPAATAAASVIVLLVMTAMLGTVTCDPFAFLLPSRWTPTDGRTPPVPLGRLVPGSGVGGRRSTKYPR